MSGSAYRVDRSGWCTGPWDDEPDKEQFYHNGVPCLIVRNPMGALCGYAGVYPGHPWFEVNYNELLADAHGGLTYSEHCAGNICHVPKPGEPKVWWLGFDCAHSGDLVPGMPPPFQGDSYCTIGYVRAQCRALAEQIQEAAE